MITKAAIACVLVVGAAAAVQTYRLRGVELELVNQRVDWERESGVAVRAALDEGNRRTAAVQKEVEDARKKTHALEAARAGAADAGRRLRDELAAARARTCPKPGNTPAPSGGPTAEATERVLADVQRRLDEAEERVAAYASAAALAGQTCERSYDALTP
ncbi:DUF2514 family protein [Hydrogenophaga sp.]|uniref:DUF2514 family protein n=1 Tax=Hydrogenophaga sp. TaxID=1904254 RepID=UPI003D0E4963